MPSGNNGGQLNENDPTGDGGFTSSGPANGPNSINGPHTDYRPDGSPIQWRMGTHGAGWHHDNEQNTPQYGGASNLSNVIAGQYLNQGNDFSQRNISDANSSPWRVAQGQARGYQNDALAMQNAAAHGLTPSAAAINQGAALNQGLTAQAGAAHRGGMFAGLAAGNAMGAGAGAMSSVVRNGSQNRSDEINASNRAYLGAASDMRKGDTSALGSDYQRELAQGQMNQQGQLASEGLANQVLTDQLNADTSKYSTDFATTLGVNSAMQGLDRGYQRQLNGAYASGASGAAQMGLSAAMNGGGSPPPAHVSYDNNPDYHGGAGEDTSDLNGGQ